MTSPLVQRNNAQDSQEDLSKLTLRQLGKKVKIILVFYLLSMLGCT